jgi:phage terminase large subunit GpA-like protein
VTLFHGRKTNRLQVTICNPVTGATFIDFEYSWGEEVGWDYECPKCGHSNSVRLGDLTSGWFGRGMFASCDHCGKRLPFEVSTEDAT